MAQIAHLEAGQLDPTSGRLPSRPVWGSICGWARLRRLIETVSRATLLSGELLSLCPVDLTIFLRKRLGESGPDDLCNLFDPFASRERAQKEQFAKPTLCGPVRFEEPPNWLAPLESIGPSPSSLDSNTSALTR